MLFNLIGSLGLFLLGMWLMTEGLKLAGGKALEHVLGTWTSSRRRGLATGISITALVQSSSAVTVATIGFVNAGLMSFSQALWVVFGSNVGTTLTAWIITFFGFSLNIDAYTFPLIGIGAALHIFSPYQRGKALGMALAGFGLLFMGIGSLQENFSQHAHEINLATLFASSSFPSLMALSIGFILTLLTQSSSAAIAIILTSLASGVSNVDIAAAAVIGANIGTTSTAILATLGATANAKRLALAHLAFNAITALVALIIMPAFLLASKTYSMENGASANLLLLVAMFHTGFNILGVIIIWPLERTLSKYLLSFFQQADQVSKGSTHLDSNVATIPDLAIRALNLELDHIISATKTLRLPTATQASATEAEMILDFEAQLEQIEAFIALSFKSELTETQANLLTAGLSTSYHLKNTHKIFLNTLEHFNECRSKSTFAEQTLTQWFETVNEHLEQLNQQQFYNSDKLQEAYQSLKTLLIKASANKRLEADILDNALQTASYSRRLLEQLIQAYQAFSAFSQDTRNKTMEGIESHETEDTTISSFSDTETTDGLDKASAELDTNTPDIENNQK